MRMAEGVQSKDVFYINGSFVNHTSSPQLAQIMVSDDKTILERTEGYTVTITRFSVDTQSNMFFIQKDEAKRVAVEIMYQEQQQVDNVQTLVWRVRRAFDFALTDDMPTLTAFLHFWNSHHEPIVDDVFPKLSVDSAGRFNITPVVKDALLAVAVANQGIPCGVRIQMTDAMTDMLGMEEVSASLCFQVSNYRRILETLDFVREVIGENQPKQYLDDDLQQNLREIATLCIDKVNPVTFANGDNHTKIRTKSSDQDTSLIGAGRWAKLFFDDTDGTGTHRSRSQYVWIHGHRTLGNPDADGNVTEYRTHHSARTGSPDDHMYGFNSHWDNPQALIPWKHGTLVPIPRMYTSE